MTVLLGQGTVASVVVVDGRLSLVVGALEILVFVLHVYHLRVGRSNLREKIGVLKFC